MLLPADTIPPTIITILGGTGNLAETKLLPALFDLYRGGRLPQATAIVGVSRKDWQHSDYARYVIEAVELARPRSDKKEITQFASLVHYQRGNFDDVQMYEGLSSLLTTIDTQWGQCTNKLFYLAVPPQYYSTIFTQLSRSGVMSLCDSESAWTRLLVEKPFGRDLATAQALEEQLRTQFNEDQIYRIDHYLAKDAIENILALRFANRVLADSWHKGEVERIEIRMLETKDVATRGSFYDGIGALRDVGQNHVLQILALLTMTAADVRDTAALRAARARIIAALLPPTTMVRGQYVGYQDTFGVATDSDTETYFRLETTLALPEWEGVPIMLEAGKALDRSLLEAVVTFKTKEECHCAAEPEVHVHQNVLTITMAPEQKITLRLFVKKPGFAYELEPRDLTLVHTPALDDYSPEAYERVLYDCLVGDQSRFVSSDEVTAAWRFITPLLEESQPAPVSYQPGSAGPQTTT